MMRKTKTEETKFTYQKNIPESTALGNEAEAIISLISQLTEDLEAVNEKAEKQIQDIDEQIKSLQKEKELLIARTGRNFRVIENMRKNLNEE